MPGLIKTNVILIAHIIAIAHPFTLLLLLVDTTAEQGIGQIQHCLCQTAAHGMQVSRIGAEQIQQVHGLAYLPGKLSARDDRTLPFRNQAVRRQHLHR